MVFFSTPLSRHGQPGFETLTFDAISKLRDMSARTPSITMATNALSWVAGQELVVSAVVGARNAEQVAQNAKLQQLDKVSFRDYRG